VKEEVRLHLDDAEDCLAQAELLLSASHPGAAVSRAYYAMFHGDEKAQEVLGWAKEFVAACRKLCE
jgi:uncharacterized protein (UPF0332 family)